MYRGVNSRHARSPWPLFLTATQQSRYSKPLSLSQGPTFPADYAVQLSYAHKRTFSANSPKLSILSWSSHVSQAHDPTWMTNTHITFVDLHSLP